MKKVIVISGCSSGLGKFIAQKLAERKFIVYAGVRKNSDKEKLEKEFTNIETLHFVKLDVTKNEDCLAVIKNIFKKEKRLDVLINNAGLTLNGSIQDFSDEEFLNLLNTNTIGPFRLIKSVIPFMQKKGGGKIINITSLNGLLALPGFSLYCASKFGLQAFGESLFYELSRYNICVTNLAPGAIQNPSKSSSKMTHKPAREKFFLLKFLMPMLTYEELDNKIEKIIKSQKPPRIVILGNDAHITLFLQRFLPNSLWEKLMMFVWKR